MKKVLVSFAVSFLLLVPSALGVGLSYLNKDIHVNTTQDSIDYNIWISSSSENETQVNYTYTFEEMNQYRSEIFIIGDGPKRVSQEILIPSDPGTYSPHFSILREGSGNYAVSTGVLHTVNLVVKGTHTTEKSEKDGGSSTSGGTHETPQTEAPQTETPQTEIPQTCEDISCGEDMATDWTKYCVENTLVRNRTYFDAGCEDAECYNRSSVQSEILENCSHRCVNATCIEKNKSEYENNTGGSKSLNNTTAGETQTPTGSFLNPMLPLAVIAVVFIVALYYYRSRSKIDL